MINSTIKKTTKSNGTNGIKALIMAGSLAVTLGGWGILAAGQLQNTVATVAQPQAIVQPVNNSNNTQNLRQVNVTNNQPRAVARTRSSR